MDFDMAAQAMEEIRQRETSLSFAALMHDANDEFVPNPAQHQDSAVAFRMLYDSWVKRGDYERGKPRHSVRQIKTWLGENQVRSLETKLAGKTWLPYEDAFTLLKLFLTRWTYDREANIYRPYSSGDLDELARGFLKELFRGDERALLLPDRKRISANDLANDSASTSPVSRDSVFTRPTGDYIKELFAESDALITISRATTVIGSDPPTAMADFHRLLEELYLIDQKDRRNRTLIWIIDFGLRNDQIPARRAIYNFYFLVAQFRAIALLRREDRDSFYTWLNKSTCFIVGSLSKDEIERIYLREGIELPAPPTDHFWFISDRLFLESVPSRWLDAPGSEAFGSSQKKLWDSPTITAHLKLDDWDLDHTPDVDYQKNLRYLFHGEVVHKGDDPDGENVRGIALPEPGMRWSNAYRLAVQAALGRLKRPSDRRISEVDSPEALAMLANQNFAALRLREFVGLARTLVDEAYESLSSNCSQ